MSAAADRGYLMIDSTAVRVQMHGPGPAGGQLAQAMGRSRASLSIKIHLACDALGYPLGFILTGANVSDYDQALPLLRAQLRHGAYVLMDKGYDSDAIRAYVNQHGGVAVIAVNSSRSLKPPFDQPLYRERHRIENLFARLKSFRRISTRYDKLALFDRKAVSAALLRPWPTGPRSVLLLSRDRLRPREDLKIAPRTMSSVPRMAPRNPPIRSP